MTRLTIVDVCNALFKVKKFPMITFLVSRPTLLTIAEHAKTVHHPKCCVVYERNLYCLYLTQKMNVVSFGASTQHFQVLRHITTTPLSLEDICMLAHLYYTSDYKVFANYVSVQNPLEYVRVMCSGWTTRLSEDVLNVTQNTPTCSSLTPFGIGYVFENNFHRLYHPVELTLFNGHHVHLRVPFHRMTWHDFLVQAKQWLILHYLVYPDVVQDIHAQLTAMQNGYMSFFSCEIDQLDHHVVHFGPDVLVHAADNWTNPNDMLQLPQTLKDLVWEYVFDIQGHKNILKQTQIPRSRLTTPGSEWRKPHRLFVY